MSRVHYPRYGIVVLNPFLANFPILYFLKKNRKPRVLWCFQVVLNGNIGQNWGNEWSVTAKWLQEHVYITVDLLGKKPTID